MNLHTYFQLPDALTVSELRERIGAKSDAQIRQWQHGYADRRPSPENCLSIERATNGMVTRQDLRPDDFWLIWPDLAAPGTTHPVALPDTANGLQSAMDQAGRDGTIQRRLYVRRADDRARDAKLAAFEATAQAPKA